jgi:hypothetical protein
MIIGLLLLSVLSCFAQTIKGEFGYLYLRNNTKILPQTGFRNWCGRKGCFYHSLTVEESFRSEDTRFKLSVISGKSLNPYACSRTTNERFGNDFKSFNIKELFAEGNIYGFSVTVGKFGVNLFPTIDDFFWGGKVSKDIEGFKVTYFQLQGYEGKYYLLEGESEDDIDVYGLKLEKGTYSLTAFRISDVYSDKNKNTISFCAGENFRTCASLQNGKWLFYGAFNRDYLSISAGHSDSGYTSHGFREGIRDLGLVLKPGFGGNFFKVSYKWKNFEPYFLILDYRGELYEEGGLKAEKKLGNGALFLKTAYSERGSYFLSAGYSFHSLQFLVPKGLKNVKTEWKLKVKGEYIDMKKKDYATQLGYDWWNDGKHIGFWRTFFSQTFKVNNFTVEVSTGPDSRKDFVVWGNDLECDCQKDREKLWHFEKAFWNKNHFKLGLQEVKIPGFVNQNLVGLGYEDKNFLLGAFGRKAERYLTAGAKYGKLKAFWLLKKRDASDNAGILNYEGRFLTAGITLEESGRKGGYVQAFYNFLGLKTNLLFASFGKDFSTFKLKEFFRDLGNIYKPSEKDLNVFSVSLGKNLFGIDCKATYRRFSHRNGNYIGEEGGITVSYFIWDKAKITAEFFLGDHNSHYEGATLEMLW